MSELASAGRRKTRCRGDFLLRSWVQGKVCWFACSESVSKRVFVYLGTVSITSAVNEGKDEKEDSLLVADSNARWHRFLPLPRGRSRLLTAMYRCSALCVYLNTGYAVACQGYLVNEWMNVFLQTSTCVRYRHLTPQTGEKVTRWSRSVLPMCGHCIS